MNCSDGPRRPAVDWPDVRRAGRPPANPRIGTFTNLAHLNFLLDGGDPVSEAIGANETPGSAVRGPSCETNGRRFRTRRVASGCDDVE
jgi:hypothetical protein